MTKAIDQTNIAAIWGELRENVGPMLGGNLEVGGLPAIFGPNSLVLRFGLRYTSQYDYCSSSESVKRIQSALKEITGKEWNLRMEMEPAGDGRSRQYRRRNKLLLKQLRIVNGSKKWQKYPWLAGRSKKWEPGFSRWTSDSVRANRYPGEMRQRKSGSHKKCSNSSAKSPA